MSDPAGGRDPAFAKWVAIQGTRLAGVAVFVYGALAASGRAPWIDGAPREWAWALALIGASDAILVPLVLARMWSSDKS